jgi:hypothetical protein
MRAIALHLNHDATDRSPVRTSENNPSTHFSE